MKIKSTSVLKGVIVLIGLIVFVICGYVLPGLILSELETNDFDFGWIFVGLYVTAIPFFYALVQAWRLLNYIDQKQAFTKASVAAFRSIKFCALMISGLFLAGMPYVFHIAQQDDAPGLVAVGLIIVFASFVIAAFAALLQSVIQNAVDIKSENDLTV